MLAAHAPCISNSSVAVSGTNHLTDKDLGSHGLELSSLNTVDIDRIVSTKAGEMAEWIKHLLHGREEQSWGSTLSPYVGWLTSI